VWQKKKKREFYGIRTRLFWWSKIIYESSRGYIMGLRHMICLDFWWDLH